MKGLEAAGAATITSFKLRKHEAFFTKYFIYFLLMSILFFLAYTLYATPFVAFGYEMTPDYHERTRLHAFANTVGQFAWLGVPWFYAIMSSTLFRGYRSWRTFPGHRSGHPGGRTGCLACHLLA
ncbi:MAG: MFS transporter [Candidatus Cloacimonetes bacterium]|nr:MFS transporter [Candidatus Cloacimonadota bacterium]